MQVIFRECNFFDLWIWLEFSMVPSLQEKQLIEEVFDSWFFLGKLGGFNAENVQVQEMGVEISYFDYDVDAAEQSLMSLMHNMGDLEYQGTWGRCWLDLGTTDALALDVLINALRQLNREYITIEGLYIGGENEDWPVTGSESRASFVYDDN